MDACFCKIKKNILKSHVCLIVFLTDYKPLIFSNDKSIPYAASSSLPPGLLKSAVVSPFFWVRSKATCAERDGTRLNTIPSKIPFRSSSGMNWMVTLVILSAVMVSLLLLHEALACDS